MKPKPPLNELLAEASRFKPKAAADQSAPLGFAARTLRARQEHYRDSTSRAQLQTAFLGTLAALIIAITATVFKTESTNPADSWLELQDTKPRDPSSASQQ
ncbi:hypothetical protein ACFQY0_16315 [Haloferula chungangensis]|uniref:Uncharacterized protein n=1 Tax=Haloferula chungangensis TaxID=1048331 RepID=A0ABW2L8N4_9BACT